MKFEKQVLDRYGPAQVGFGRRSDLTVYSESVFADPRLSSQALRLTRESSYKSCRRILAVPQTRLSVASDHREN